MPTGHMYGGHFWGMHWIWWILWILLLIWIFLIPYDLPGQRKKIETPIDILKKRYAKGEISTEEFEERKNRLEKE